MFPFGVVEIVISRQPTGDLQSVVADGIKLGFENLRYCVMEPQFVCG